MPPASQHRPYLSSVAHPDPTQCPMCRAACHGEAGDCGTNLAMVSIIMSQFPRQYEERQKEVGTHERACFCFYSYFRRACRQRYIGDRW